MGESVRVWDYSMVELPILVAEDNEDDLFLLQHACDRAGFRNPLHAVRDGEQALAYLRGEGAYADRAKYPFPVLVLLDIKMPGMSGLEVLSTIRLDSRFKRLVVIVLSSSKEEKDINRAFDLQANSYLVKPDRAEAMYNIAQNLKSFWLSMNHFPDCPIATHHPSA